MCETIYLFIAPLFRSHSTFTSPWTQQHPIHPPYFDTQILDFPPQFTTNNNTLSPQGSNFPTLSPGYEQVFERKPMLPFQEKDDGCFMMFKSDKFKLLRNESLGLFKPHEKFLDKPNCAQIIVLECSGWSLLSLQLYHR